MSWYEGKVYMNGQSIVRYPTVQAEDDVEAYHKIMDEELNEGDILAGVYRIEGRDDLSQDTKHEKS